MRYNSVMPEKPFAISPENSTNDVVLDIFGDQVTIQVSGDHSDKCLTVIHSVTPPAGGPPLHLHLSETEVFFVIEGSFLFVLDEEPVQVETGGTVFIPPRTRHQYQNVGETPGKLLIILTPAGLDQFFVELDALLKEQSVPDMPAIAALHAKFGMELLGPPLSTRP